ncbi:DNA polymerase zeta catalytic subunit isoform X1 [Python bivittatus]|uniref:DNA polymerase zeta catalytic subunit n=2 Tax=Python bivittatus TaxID=176946 RepID=A0A9F2N8B8_PYTBI|nr:DNA polymerase zeta catalytic subunit isoform X1 [Python bivittatus]
MFSVRVVTADYYMSSPLPGLDPCQSSFREAPVKKVPVVRVFGATPSGQKTCLHLHGIFPYLYVPYDGYGHLPDHYLRSLAFSIDRALNVTLGNPSSSVQHVFKVSLVYGMPFYGYHEKERQFMKIYLYNPAMVKRVCELLQGGAIMNKIYQPHEAHIPYLLQLFIDYNLYGMNLINLAAVKFRKIKKKGDTFEEIGSCGDNWSRSSATRPLRWEDNQIPSSLILEGIEPQSTCELEVDAVAADILNRLDIEAQIGQNPGLQAIWEDEKQRRRENKESSQISPPNSQDRGFVATTESERIFQKRLKDILKQSDFSVTSGSMDSNNESQEFSAELTLHSEVPTVVSCSPANMIEVHSDKELHKEESESKYKEDALINEEAILNIMENSQYFQPLSQRFNNTPVFMNDSADQAMIHLLAGLEDDGYEIVQQNTLSQHYSSGNYRNLQNSDDEENEPQIEKEEMELSLLMSQQWDSSSNDVNAKRRSVGRSRNQSSGEDNSSSEDDMDWNDNMLLASLSIPQLDGTADENSDNPLNNEGSRTHTSAVATSKTSVKTTIFHKDAATLEPPSSAKITFQCKHTSALSSHVLNTDDLEGLTQPSMIDIRPDLSIHSLSKESTYNIKYPASFNNILHSEKPHQENNKSEKGPVLCETAYEDISSVSRHMPSRKYTGIRKATKDVSQHMNHQSSESILIKKPNFIDLVYSKNKTTSEINKKANTTNINSLFPAPENCETMSCSEGNQTLLIHSSENSTDGDSLNNFKIRYEEFQEHKSEKTNINQQAAHYMFFPSVVLSNCLNQPQKLGPVTYKLQQGKKQSKLKRNKKKMVLSNQQSASARDALSTKESCYIQDNASSNIPDRDVLLPNDTQVHHLAFENKMSTDAKNCTDCHFEDFARESEQTFGLCGNKYTLRAKRKINYETEDSESSFGIHNSKITLPHSVENDENVDGSKKCRKRRRLSKKLPPVIIKYIIINRFRGRKNMLVKLGKIDSSEEQVLLTEDKMNLYKKLAPLKDFWPKVPDSPATKYPIYPLTPKKSHKRKAKCKSAKKRLGGKPQNIKSKNIKRTLYFRKRTHAFLSPPLPSYSAEAEDCDLNYSDVMSKLGFLSERSASPVNVSPPRCWSPTDPNAEEIVNNLEKETLVFKNTNTFSSKTVNPYVGKHIQSKTQVKKCKKQFASATVRSNKKSNQSNKPRNDLKKKPRSKQKQKIEKVSTLMTIADGQNSIPPVAELKLMLNPWDLPENVHNLGNSQPLYAQKEIPPTGCSTGHPSSAQLSLTANAQVNPLIYFHSLLENEKPIGHQGSSLTEDLHPGIASMMSGREKAKISFQRSNSQSGIFRMKESSIQNNVYDQCNCISQVALNAYSSKDAPKKTEEVANSQNKILSSEGKVNENCISSDVISTDQIHPGNFLHCKDSQQQIVYLSEAAKHADHISSFLKTSEENHGSFQLPKKCFVASLRSPVKKLEWEQKQRGFILDVSHFNPEKNTKQKGLSETISQAQTDSQCKGKGLVTASAFSEGHSGLAVLKELLQKRHQKMHMNNIHEQASVKSQLNRDASFPLDANKPVKKTCSVASPRKPRIPRDKKSKEKAVKLLKDSAKQISNKTGHVTPVESPIFYSDPGFESCYSLEDSLSPDHNYNFDINAIGQTGFCSLYSASQFVPADQNLPQKFLSDAAQDHYPGQTAETELLNHNNKISKEENMYNSDPTSWLRSGPLSPQLFDKRCLENNENLHSQWKNVIPSTSQPGSPADERQAEMCHKEQFQLDRNIMKKTIFLNLSSPNGDWSQNPFRKEIISEPGQSLDSVSISFSSILSSPDGELMDAASEDLELYISRNTEGLTPTPDSSPRSTNSPSQSKNGSSTPRAAHILKPLMSPPSREEIMSTLLDHDLAETIYQEPFCSNPSDVPEKPREIGGRVLTVETRLPNDLLEFEGDFSLEGLQLWKTAFLAMAQSPRSGSPLRNSQFSTDKKQRNTRKINDKKIVIMPCKCAPSYQQIQSWLQAKEDYEYFKKRVVLKSTDIEKIDESLNNMSLPKNLCHQTVKVAVNSGIPSKPTVQSEDLCFSTSNPTSPQTMENSGINISELSKTTVKERTVPLVTAVIDMDKKEEDYINYSSPDSPVLPPWQQVASTDSKQSNLEDSEGILSSVEENKSVTEKEQKSVKKESKIPFCVSPLSKELDGNSETICFHSTPIREHISQGIPEALGCTPLSATGQDIQKLNSRRGRNTDALRKVLLTTQIKNQFTTINTQKKETSQIEGPSLNNSYGFKISVQNLQEAKALHEVQYLTLLSIELHARTRRDLEADPEFDPICALFYCISSDTPLPDTEKMEITGAVVIDKDRARTISSQGNREHAPLLARSGISGLEVTYATDERALFQEVVNIVKRYDPDILLGYEVQMHSWGYLLQRAAALDVDLCQMISRVPDDKKENRFASDLDEYGADTMSEINIVGRVILNIWRIMRHEVTLTNYTFENVSFHILHQRFPLFTSRVLSDWFDNKADIYRWKIVDYYTSRVRGNIQLLEQVDLIGKTSEMARLFGIQFLHVLTRGSQYRVESMMLRIAKPMNYIAVTPSVQQRAHMRAPQCIPLILEPESRFYSNAVLVLDFQSLYPSIVIAYNYCFSTCLGHVENLGKYDEFKFGCTSLRVSPDLLYQLRHDITISPSGIAFVKPSVRKGVLPRMLEEILKTRIMVKQSMKAYKLDKTITRMLEARQLGLKLIANVTFGYTGANFSGRMPCIEIADSIVHKARETLERAIKLVNDTKKWGARVVYGDTDSMFVLLKGATKEQSFKIGQEIAEAVTATNPKPVKLKFEKVYLPCILQTKKRYVGYMYETLDQKDPVFDAKGIETVRRDSCPAVSKILERSIKLLFETRDISHIKQYVQNQCMKLLEGKASMQDFIFAKEYRGSSAYRPGACVPALEITRKMLTYDRRSEPRVGERVPYVIVYGMPGLPLIQLVRRPIEVLQDPNLRLNATYYITKQILPPLARILSLIGIDVFSWYNELPRIQKVSTMSRTEQECRKGTISQYFTTLHCPVCDELTQHGICSKCRSQPQHVIVMLNQEIRELERKHEQIIKICKNCTSCFDRQIPCVSLNCPVLFKVSRVSRELSKAPYLRQLLDQF